MASIISAGTTSGTSLNLSADTSGVLQLATNGTTTAVTIDTSQNVGIGTSSPAQKLDVSGGSIRLTSGASTADFLLVDTGTTSGNVRLRSQSNAMQFITGGGVSATIDSSGNVGIGTSSPASLLHITGNDPTIRLTDNAGSPAATWSMRSTDGNFAIRDVTNSVDRATFNANGCMALTGANLTATGVGITFPATQSASSDANTLDDYEEGTWSPSVGGNATYAAQVGRYTKIGNIVSVTFDFSIATIGTGSTANIVNLPFATISEMSATGSVSFYSTLTTAFTWIGCYAGGSTTNVAFVGNNASAVTSINFNGVALFGNNSRILGSIVYRVA